MQVIDEFHLQNDKDPSCRVKYDPKKIKDIHLKVNFECAEQTFSWLSRFKHILCTMPKTHHLFYLHRLVKRRNIYTEQCHMLSRHPLLPHSIDAI